MICWNSFPILILMMNLATMHLLMYQLSPGTDFDLGMSSHLNYTINFNHSYILCIYFTFSKFRAEIQKKHSTFLHDFFPNVIAIRVLDCVSNLTIYNENVFEISLYFFVSIWVENICHNFYQLSKRVIFKFTLCLIILGNGVQVSEISVDMLIL